MLADLQADLAGRSAAAGIQASGGKSELLPWMSRILPQVDHLVQETVTKSGRLD